MATEPIVLIFDFDGTVADTSASPPRGMGVKQAYEKAVEAVFTAHGLGYYLDHGGLRNRAPDEVVRDLLGYFGPDCQDLWPERIAGINKLLASRRYELTAFGVYNFPAEVTEENLYEVATELLVTLKLELLHRQIGQELGGGKVWPAPLPEFCEFWCNLPTDGSVLTGIVSSGHRAFIDKFFETYHLRPPAAMVTNDETRCLPASPVKPDEHLVRMLFDELDCHPAEEQRILFGDCPEKDGDLAKNARCKFVLVDPDGNHPGHPNRITSWGQAHKFLSVPTAAE